MDSEFFKNSEDGRTVKLEIDGLDTEDEAGYGEHPARNG